MALCKKNVWPKTLESFCIKAMCKAGMEERDAQITADVLVTTDTWGVYTHGSKQICGLMKNYRDGRMDMHARSELLKEGPAWGLFDAHHAMPMPVSVAAMQMAIDKAKTEGIGITAVRNSGHYGAAGYYACMAAQQDMFGISVTNVDRGVAVPGSRGPVLGTNPWAYAVPAGQEPPVMLDIATSIVAASKVFAARDLGQKVQEGWIIDKDGLPTTDPTDYPKVGALLPMAGHKGYGIALMVEILSGVLAGGAFGKAITSWVLEMPEPVNQSHTFIAINIDKFLPIQQFRTQIDSLIREIKNAPKAKGTERIYLPGEMEHEARQKALRQGMMLPDHVMLRLQKLSEDYELDVNRIYDK